MESKLSQLISALGLNQIDFAKEIGTSRTIVNQIVLGNRNIGITLISRVKARWPNVDVNWFFQEGIPLFLDSSILISSNDVTKKCTRCVELEGVIRDQQETITTLRKAIESNNILFEAMREQVKKR